MLEMEKGATLLLNSGTLRLNQARLLALPESPIELKGNIDASIEFIERRKVCFDYLHISSLRLTGAGVVTAGEHSVITNSPNWQNTKCENVLFADFEIEFPCQGGLAELNQKSQGLPESWFWSVTPETPIITTKQGTVVLVPVGDATSLSITLKAEAGTRVDQVTKVVTPKSNSLATNHIVANSETLISFVEGERYRWFHNGVELEGEVKRSLQYNGLEGTYFVVAYDNECNSLSDTHLVTGINKEAKDLFVYPNPAHTSIFIKDADSVYDAQLVSSTGQRWPTNRRGNEIDVHSLPEGLYLLILHRAAGSVNQKIMITHSR
jgi:hypothetical protein